MKYEHILIRFGELNTKGKNKQDFINTLFRNVKKALKPFASLEYIKAHDRIYIQLHDEDVEDVVSELKQVSGIASFSLVVKCENNPDIILDTALNLINQVEGKTFKVVTTRADKRFPIHSDEMNRMIATVILEKTERRVDIHTPDIKVMVEIRAEGSFIYTEKITGAGGYPLGVGGKALVLLSGGIDSPVASYLMMKRGIKIEAIHFASPPYTSEGAKAKVIDLLKVLSHIQGPIKLHIVPFTKLQEAIFDCGDESYAITLMRRMMYRIAEGVASRRRCKALVSGESIGQVASQTLDSMGVINEVIKMPMIRPLACSDKNDIIDLSKKIKTYEISIRPFIDCCTIFTPKNPVTKPNLKRAQELEKRFDYETLVKDCIENVTSFYVDEKYTPNEEIDKFF